MGSCLSFQTVYIMYDNCWYFRSFLRFSCRNYHSTPSSLLLLEGIYYISVWFIMIYSIRCLIASYDFSYHIFWNIKMNLLMYTVYDTLLFVTNIHNFTKTEQRHRTTVRRRKLSSSKMNKLLLSIFQSIFGFEISYNLYICISRWRFFFW